MFVNQTFRLAFFAAMLLGCLIQVSAAADPFPANVAEEFARLKGTWDAEKRVTDEGEDQEIASSNYKYQLTIRTEGVQWSLLALNGVGNIRNRQSQSATISLDPAKDPKTLDIKISARKKSTLLAIYKLEGNKLTVVMGPSRPKSFEAKGKDQVLYVFKKRES